MSYDFFVFPAERAEGLEEALAVYERTAERGTLSADSAVARFVADLNTAVPVQREGGFLSVRVDGTDEGSYVCTSWDDPMGNLRKVAGLARPHQLAVLDVQLGALYDPRRSLDVGLQTEAGPAAALRHPGDPVAGAARHPGRSLPLAQPGSRR